MPFPSLIRLHAVSASKTNRTGPAGSCRPSCQAPVITPCPSSIPQHPVYPAYRIWTPNSPEGQSRKAKGLRWRQTYQHGLPTRVRIELEAAGGKPGSPRGRAARRAAQRKGRTGTFRSIRFDITTPETKRTESFEPEDVAAYLLVATQFRGRVSSGFVQPLTSFDFAALPRKPSTSNLRPSRLRASRRRFHRRPKKQHSHRRPPALPSSLLGGLEVGLFYPS